MGLGAGSGSGPAGATQPATTYNAQAGLSVSTSTINANVKAGTNAVLNTGTQIINSTTPLINIQANAGAAPNTLGNAQMIQFEALVNNLGTGYPNTILAQEALIAVAGYWGYDNLAFANNTTTGTNAAVLAW